MAEGRGSKSKQIQELLSEGKTVQEIAEKMQCSTALVYNVRSKSKIGKKTPAPKKKTAKKVSRRKPVAQFNGETSGFLVQYEALILADDLLKKCGGSREQAMQAIATIIMLEESRKGSE